MMNPDEALLWAREHWATICDEDGFPEVAEAYRRGDRDESLRDDIEAYRAAASAARIKALEDEVRDAIAYIEFQRPDAVNFDHLISKFTALLKEADQ